MNSKFFLACVISISIITEACAMQRAAGLKALIASYMGVVIGMPVYAHRYAQQHPQNRVTRINPVIGL